ncbi:hypothetical protein TD95_005326 [Thielaviopsis punctulata]|uniref:Cytokinesis regulator n=1 Tax=Thielaviopsis punctulata TaxID=72032 RepID=A0A0F4Z733_9PEZI|nr:hypothetical protein TD95_005326 [Thielaviopsis punctulata]
MDTFRLKQREPALVAADIENWDDDDFLIDDEISFHGRMSAGAPTVPQSPSFMPHRRDSHSSHISLRSERSSINGDERHVLLPNDEKSAMDAIQVAVSMGIPIPQNVPASALMGGSINRLGGRKRRVSQDDWEADLEFPGPDKPLKLKKKSSRDFPATLRQVSNSSANTMASDIMHTPPHIVDLPIGSPRRPIMPINLDQFRDTDDDDDFFGGDTIRVTKRQQRQPISLITPPTPQQNNSNSRVSIAKDDDDFEADFELPMDGKLTLGKSRDITRPSLSQVDELDWGDGTSSHGTRYSNTRREHRSTRSSSSALSPSVASSITVESEDEALDGLILPPGVLNLEDRLNSLSNRRMSISPEPLEPAPELSPPSRNPASGSEKEDFFSGLEIGEGAFLDSRKNTVHKNVKRKNSNDRSPPRIKATASITFTNKPPAHQPSLQPSQSRLPRLNHDRTQSLLETVSESGGPVRQRLSRRPPSRTGHSSQLSAASVAPPPATVPASTVGPAPAPTPVPASTTTTTGTTAPRRRELSTKTSSSNLREPTTTNAQLLRMKRSLPVMRGTQTSKMSTTSGPNSHAARSPSRTDSVSTGSRPNSFLRTKTPTPEGTSNASGTGSLRKPPPFQSGLSSQSISTKPPRLLRRHMSEMSLDVRPKSRTVSRSGMRSPSPRRYRANEKATVDGTWRQFSKPKTRHFGDGHELDAFDDLPTSASSEAKFVKAPVASGNNKTALRGKLYGNMQSDRRDTTPSPAPFTPNSAVSASSSSGGYTPRFARDTTSSRIAREASLAQRAPSYGSGIGTGSSSGTSSQHPTPTPTPRVSQLANRNSFTPGMPSPVRSRKAPKKTQQKPHLISNMSGGKESKTVNGMCYNPDTYRWEGNDGALAAFEPAAHSLSPLAVTIPPSATTPRDKETSTPRPALITNISATKGVQVVGGMVFDPHNMCWLKIGHHQRGPRSRPSSSNLHSTGGSSSQADIFDTIDIDTDSDDDPFKDIPDLVDNTADNGDFPYAPGLGGVGMGGGYGGRGASDMKDEWLVGEEFDVGPEFVRRQREEEERWRKKCERWLAVSNGRQNEESWRWTLRDLVVGDYH